MWLCSCALWLRSSRMWSRPLRSAQASTSSPLLLATLTICRVCAVCDHRCLFMLLCTQDRRTGVARRCSLLLYIGLDHTEPSASSGAAPHRHAASVLWAPVHRGRLPRAPLAPRASGARVVRVGRAAGARDRWARYVSRLRCAIETSLMR